MFNPAYFSLVNKSKYSLRAIFSPGAVGMNSGPVLGQKGR
uniref:Uncharacterized protein n=1 Tax=Setaria viridis TaxID=4556 RepID=A0A4U6UTP3_SETVI|nr:hypothetical protein SEVIR_5G365901v2 [Setaria viridis]